MSHSSWAEYFFIEKADIFLKIMNERWNIAPLEAGALEKVLLRFDVSEGKILDLMCGNGRLAVYLAEKGYQVVGIDFSEKFIEDARNRAKLMGVDDRVKFVKADIRNLYNSLKEEAPFDAVINFWTSVGYYGVETDFKMFRDARRLTRDRGILIIADTVSRESLLVNFHPSSYAEFTELVVLHKASFDPVESVLDDLWRFYKKEGKNLIFLDSVRLRIRIYSLSEMRELLEKAGWKVIAAYDSILSLEPVRKFSNINFVALAVEDSLDI